MTSNDINIKEEIANMVISFKQCNEKKGYRKLNAIIPYINKI